MPAKSKAQRRFMAMCQHSDHPPSRCPDMSNEQYDHFSKTNEKDLPFRATKKDKRDLGNGYRSK